MPGLESDLMNHPFQSSLLWVLREIHFKQTTKWLNLHKTFAVWNEMILGSVLSQHSAFRPGSSEHVCGGDRVNNHLFGCNWTDALQARDMFRQTLLLECIYLLLPTLKSFSLFKTAHKKLYFGIVSHLKSSVSFVTLLHFSMCKLNDSMYVLKAD